jgi:hypothetical protein
LGKDFSLLQSGDSLKDSDCEFSDRLGAEELALFLVDPDQAL